MIQAAQVASKFTLFTHHAKTFPDLITALRNSMLRTGTFNNEIVAEQQVVSVINFDIHLIKDFRGRRYIERITECVPVVDVNNYEYDNKNKNSIEGKLDTLIDNQAIYYAKSTNKELFHYVNILEYQDGNYVVTNPISDTNIEQMYINMSDEDAANFKDFVKLYWGYTLSDRGVIIDRQKVPPSAGNLLAKDAKAAAPKQAAQATTAKGTQHFTDRKSTTTSNSTGKTTKSGEAQGANPLLG